MFLGVTAQVVGFDAEKKEFSLVLEENPRKYYFVFCMFLNCEFFLWNFD
jgi:hypothetical protein